MMRSEIKGCFQFNRLLLCQIYAIFVLIWLLSNFILLFLLNILVQLVFKFLPSFHYKCEISKEDVIITNIQSMEANHKTLVPKKFSSSFKHEIQRNTPLAKTTQDTAYFNQIYKISFELENNKPLIQNKLAEIGLSEEKYINLLLTWLKDMHEFYKNIDQLIESQNLGNLDDHNEQMVIDWKFELFIHKKYLTNSLITAFLDQNYDLEINDSSQLFEKLNQFNSIIQFDAFKQKAVPLLLQITDFDDHLPDKQNKILRALFQRNLCFDLIRSSNIENLLENKQLEVCLDILYGNLEMQNLGTSQTLKPEEQTQEQFSKRLTTFFNQNCRKFQGWKDSKKKQLVQRLYKQVPNYDYEEIVKIILEYKLKQLGTKQLITDGVLMKIFKLSSADLLHQQKAPKSQVVSSDESPKKESKQMMEQEEDLDVLALNTKKNSSLRNQKKENELKSLSKVKQVISQEENGNKNKNSIAIQQQSIQRLRKQIQIISRQTKNKNCIEIVLRQLQIAMRTGESQKVINEKIQNIRTLVQKYHLRTNCFTDLDQIQIQINPLADRLPKVSTVRSKLYVINLIDVLEGKNQIENKRAAMCKDAKAILIIGRTGAGKSTLMTALAGFKLAKSSEGDFRAQNTQIAKQIPISNRQQSQTRWANVQKLAKIYSNGKDIVIIDTPGFQDNRGVEIQITNNIATVNLIKKLESARILIVLPKEQFYGTRQIQNYTKFVKLFSAYFFNVKDFQYSLGFVLTKGLTAKQLLKTIGEIEITDTFTKIDWSMNEKNFQNIMKRKLKDLRKSNEIIDPSKHQFDSMMEQVMDLQEKQSPGSDVCESFSNVAQQSLKQTYDYHQRMVKETFDEGQFSLTNFYLNNIKQLDSIQKSSNYHQLRNFLKLAMERKVTHFHSCLKKFLSSNYDEWLNQLKTLREYFHNPESQPIYNLLYYNKLLNTYDPNPKQIFDAEIEAKLIDVNKQLSKGQKMDSNKKMEIRSTLKMMKSFGFEIEYQQINSKILNSSIKNHRELQNILNETVLDEQQWKKHVEIQINQFKQNQDLNCSEVKKYEEIKKIVEKYIFNNNQLEQIMNLKDKAMTQCLDGKLSKICSQYLKKLNKIKETHYSIKEIVEHKFKQILNQLDILIRKYEDKQVNDKTINPSDFQMWENLNENRDEIFSIKAQFADSQVLQFFNLKQEESMLKLFFNNLNQNIDILKNMVTGNVKNVQHIDPNNIRVKLQTIFGLLDAMQRKKSVSKGQYKQKDRKQETLIKTLEKSYEKIKVIISSIERTCSNEQVRNYEGNLKLMNALTVIIEFREFRQKIPDEKVKQKIDFIYNTIILKLESPLKNIENDEFVTLFSFEKLLKVLQYTKQLDEQTIILSGITNNFDYNFNFSDNKRINVIVSKCLQKVKKNYANLAPIQELSNYANRSFIKSTSKLNQEKKNNIDKIEYDLLEEAIKYIKSYKYVRLICDQFSNQLTVVEEFKNQHLQSKDLKKTVKKRIQGINQELSKKLSLDSLNEIALEFNFFRQIHLNTKSPEESEYNDIKNKIREEFIKLGKSFNTLYDEACELYKDVQNRGSGVDYSSLSELLENPGRKVQEGEQKFNKLLFKIDMQYEKILTTFYIEQDPNGKVSNSTNIFLNIIEFKKICQDASYKCKIKDDLHKSGLDNLFSQIVNGFNSLLEDIKKGKFINQKQKEMLIRYEKKIALLLKKEYDQFKVKRQIKENYFISFEKRKKEIMEKFISLYSKKETLEFDQNFLEVYQNASTQVRESMRKIAISKNEEDVEKKSDFMNCDHEGLLRFYSEKMEQGRNMPQQIFQKLMEKLKPMINQISQMEEKAKQTVEQAVQKKVPTNIILCYLKGDTVKNQIIKKTAIQAVKNYFQEEQKSLDFTDIQNLEENLQRNIALTNQDDFKNAAKKDSQFANASLRYVKTAKTKFQTRTNAYDKQVHQFRQFMRKRKMGQSFQLSNIKLNPKEYRVLSNGVNTYRVILKKPDIFSEEIDNFKKVVFERIKQGNNDLKESVLKLDNIKKQLIEKKVNSVQSVLSTLEQVHSKRVVCDAFGEVFSGVDNLNTLIQQQPLDDYDTFLTDIKSYLKQKYNDAINWNLDQFIDNQMIVCNSKENEENQKVLNLLDSFMPIFFGKNAYPANISKNIQENTQRQFFQFEKSVLEDIDNFFIPSIQCSSQKVMRYYNLLGKMRESRSLIFSQQMKIDNKVKEKLLKKFKMNVNEILAFVGKPQKLVKYNQFLTQIKNVDSKQKQDISEIQRKTDIEVREECRKIQEKIESEKSTIDAENPERREKLAKLDNQCKADKLSKQIDLNSIRDKNIENVKKENSKLKQQISSKLNNYLTSEIINPLIVFQRATTYFYCEREIKQSPYSIKFFTKQIQDKYKKTIFRFMYTLLKNIDNKHAQTLTNQKCFESISMSNWRELVAGKTFETLMKDVPHLDQISKKEKFFKDRFKKFQEIYSQLTKSFKDTSDFNETKRKFVEDTKIMGQKISETYNQNGSCRHQRWELLARIAAIWTIHRSTLDDDNNVQFIHKPHPGQILATFMLLQFDEKSVSHELKNTMVQVSTGQGKSVILGILSTYLALVGFKVYQACYSNYLSQRDYDDFADFFELFGVKGKIFYRTFPEICRMMLEESPDKPFIEKIERLLINPSIWNNIGQFLKNIFPGAEQGKKVLLIDEADAFLDENYLGESFFPSINIKKKSVENLLDFVWSYRQKSYELTPELIIKSKQFDQLCKQLSNRQFRKLMQNQANAMVRDLGNYKEDVYSLIQGEIYYKTGDSLTNKVHYGYRTVFNYYHEFYINKRISKDRFERHVSINLIIASFSYSKLPSYFSSILGVTGTLDCMSDKQKKILTDRYQVKRTFVQPSIYPPNRRVVQFYKCSEDQLFKQVAKSIQQQQSKKRPIVVFFETKNNVYDFYNSEYFSRFKMNATIVTHEVKDGDRTFRIRDSTSDGKITLLTVDFSRGTDFKLNVKNAEQHPGLHVICAFIPNSFSDYLQVVGRTGRQGKNGTVNLYFVDFTLAESTVNPMNQQVAEQMIRKLDNDHWENKYKQLTERMDNADKQHEISTKLYSQGSNADRIFKQMLQFNKEYEVVRLISRTVIGLDATCSMGLAFQKLITVIQTSLPIIRQVIQDAKVAASFEIKFVIYRNYNSKAEDLLGFSNFQSKTQTLADWLKQISVSGGWGNEALEVCLQYVNSLESVNQYVIISDAKGNLPEQVKLKREKMHGNSYFESKGFPLTSVKEQIQKLKQKNITGHFYYLNPSFTSQYYKKVAEATGGIAQQFPIDKKDSSKIFGDFIAMRILENIGSLLGGNNADNLIQRYKARAQ